MESRSTKALAIAAVVSVLLAGAAFAEESENDAPQLGKAKISLSEAVAAAEAKTGGRASKAEFANAKEGWIYDVEIVAGKAVSDVHVNAETGAVLSVVDDKVDSDEEEEDQAD
jgi:uncharacterized membrane protein YkoI